MWPFKKKIEKLKTQEVVSSIIELERCESSLEEGIVSKQKEIDDLFKKGKAEKNTQIRLFYAKKINALKQQIEADTQRAMYLLYNVTLLTKLKNTIEDNDFFVDVSGINLSKLLGDQRALAAFLNKSLRRKIKAEDMLTGADDIFNEIKESYDPNEKIHGISQSDDEALAMFEMEDAFDIESGVNDSGNNATKIDEGDK